MKSLVVTRVRRSRSKIRAPKNTQKKST
jgi:hypothetical protein